MDGEYHLLLLIVAALSPRCKIAISACLISTGDAYLHNKKMRAVIQRVSRASVSIEGSVKSSIGKAPGPAGHRRCGYHGRYRLAERQDRAAAGLQ